MWIRVNGMSEYFINSETRKVVHETSEDLPLVFRLNVGEQESEQNGEQLNDNE